MNQIAAADPREPDLRLAAPELFSTSRRRQAWLDVEAALATAQASLGLIPADAASTIRAHAHLVLLDGARLDEAAGRTGHDLVPLVAELARVCGPAAGAWVHLGATSRNIVLTGDLLLVRAAHGLILSGVAQLLAGLGQLARSEASTPMAGRTHGQHALPITFGYKVAVWIHELDAQADRLESAAGTAFAAMLGGAVGSFASFGPDGPRLQAELGRLLAMSPMALPSRSSLDQLAHYVCQLALLGVTCGKIARDVASLMATEIGEVFEPIPAGVVGSSTLPQKRNPHRCQDIVAAAALLRALVAPALEAAGAEHEGDRARNLVLHDCLLRACAGAEEVTARLAIVVAGLRVDRDRMAANLDMTGGRVCAEAVMLALAPSLGRGRAHAVVAAAASTGDFRQNLLDDEQVAEHVTPPVLDELLRTDRYLGLAPELALDAADRAADRAASLARIHRSSDEAIPTPESPDGSRPRSGEHHTPWEKQ